MKYCPECSQELVLKEVEPRKQKLACPNCTFVHWDNPTPVVAAALLWKGNLVLVRTNYMPEGRMGLPAGYVEKGESAEEAIRREVKEELSLDVEIRKLIGTYPVVRPDKNLLYVAFEVEVTNGQIEKGEEIVNVFLLLPEEAATRLQGTTAGKAVVDWLRNPTSSSAQAKQTP